MQREFEIPLKAALALLALLLAGSLASAGALQPTPGDGERAASCGTAEKGTAGCARIRGYIAAGSEFASGEKVAAAPSPFEPLFAPIVTSVGSAESAAVSLPPKIGAFLLQVSHDDGLR
jgi:hypothetical protein